VEARRKFETWIEAQGAHAYAAKALERAEVIHRDAVASLTELEALAQKAEVRTAEVQSSISKTHYAKIARLKKELSKTWAGVQVELNEAKAAPRAASEYAHDHHIGYSGVRGLPEGYMLAVEIVDLADTNPGTIWGAVLRQVLEIFGASDVAPFGKYDARSQA